MKCLELELKEELELHKFLRTTQPQNKILQNLLIRIESDLGTLVILK